MLLRIISAQKIKPVIRQVCCVSKADMRHVKQKQADSVLPWSREEWRQPVTKVLEKPCEGDSSFRAYFNIVAYMVWILPFFHISCVSKAYERPWKP